MSSNTKHKPAPAKEATSMKKPVAKMPFVFGRMNYIITAAALVVMVIGFMLMSGKDGDIYDSRRITIAPIVVVLGFCLGFVAIFYREKKQDSTEE
jgi:uncharacterized membrane protein